MVLFFLKELDRFLNTKTPVHVVPVAVGTRCSVRAHDAAGQHAAGRHATEESDHSLAERRHLELRLLDASQQVGTSLCRSVRQSVRPLRQILTGFSCNIHTFVYVSCIL